MAHLFRVNIILKLPGAVLVGEGAPLDQVGVRLLTRVRVYRGVLVQDAIHLRTQKNIGSVFFRQKS